MEVGKLRDERQFRLAPSSLGATPRPLVSPDLATCPDCLAEWANPTSRRFGYPLISCTACGPRHSILRALPLDRERTEMLAFPLCAACAEELEDPEDRRFHAQVTACPDCGPQVSGLEEAVSALARGEIIALKGLGGFQLLADARRASSILALRALKRRPHKPMAVLVPGPSSPEGPIELSDCPAELRATAELLADGLPWIGLMRPTTALHHELVERFGALVCTSANAPGEPIATRREGLPQVAAVIDHERPILRAVDDSLVRRAGPHRLLLRRARGFAPRPIALPEGPTTLGLGAHQKATICLADRGQAVLTPYLGELGPRRSIERYERELHGLLELFQARPERLVCDLHPDYASSRLGEELAARWGIPLIRLQHHEAHLAAVLAEHAHEGSALGFAWDGTGLGHDGTVRGSEVLHWDGARFEHRASLHPFPLPGGEVCARSPARSALGVFGLERMPRAEELPQAELLARASAPSSSSMGRLFDAVAFACGLPAETTWEAAAALKLEALAGRAMQAVSEGYPWGPGLDQRPLLEALLADDAPPEVRAARFHRSLIEAILRLSEGHGTILLAGGCFQNALLLEGAVEALQARGHRVLFGRELPGNDEAISLGQAWWGSRA